MWFWTLLKVWLITLKSVLFPEGIISAMKGDGSNFLGLLPAMSPRSEVTSCDVACILTHMGMYFILVKNALWCGLETTSGATTFWTSACPGTISVRELLLGDVTIAWNVIQITDTTWQHIDQSQHRKSTRRVIMSSWCVSSWNCD